MENTPVIWLHGIKPPDATKDIEERYEKWFEAAYAPLMLKSPGLTGVDCHKILKESSDYPEDLNIWYFDSLNSYEEMWSRPEVIAVVKDLNTTWPQYGREILWGAIYQPILSYRSNLVDFLRDKNSQDDAPVLNVNAFRFSAIEWEKFSSWFGEYGRRAFLPLFQTVHGLKEYHCYKWTGVIRPAAKIKEYPIFLALSYFDSLNACKSFETSPELAAFQGAIKLGFPNGFNSKWNVQYQLVKSFRK